MLAKERPYLNLRQTLAAVATLWAAACAPAPRPAPPRRIEPPALPLVRAEDPEEVHTWTRRLIRLRGADREAARGREEALNNLRRLHRRLMRETRAGSAARKARLTRFKELVVPTLLGRLTSGAATPFGAQTLVEALLAFAPRDQRVAELFLSLFERRAPPPGFGATSDFQLLLATLIKPLSSSLPRARHARLIRALEGLAARLCRGAPTGRAPGMPYHLKQAIRQALPVLNHAGVRNQLKTIQEHLKFCR